MTMRYHLTPVRMATIYKEVYKSQMLERVWIEENLPNCWWECKLVHPVWKMVWTYFRKLNLEHHRIQQSHSRPYLDQAFIKKDQCTNVFTAALFTVAKT